jgi:tetratricopeptide (TPR) repeat protein
MAHEDDPNLTSPDDPKQDGPVGQDEIDKILRDAAKSETKPEATVEDSENLSQDELDALINAGSVDDQHQDMAPDEGPTVLDASSLPLSQEDLDALIAGQDTPAEEPVTLSQADLDALIAQAGAADTLEEVTAQPPGDGGGDDPGLSEQIAREAAAFDEDPGIDELLSQDDLDALLAGVAKANADDFDMPGMDAGVPNKDTEDDAPLSQSDLDSLLRTVAEEEADGGQPEYTDTLLSQDELDDLVGQVDERKEPERKPVTVPDPPPPSASSDNTGQSLTQAELDALIVEQNARPPEAAPAPDAEPVSQTLSQNELDALLAAQAFAPAEPNVPEAPQTLSQNELDALLSGMTASPDGEAEADDKEALSQNDLDALIARTRGEEVPEPAGEDEEAVFGGNELLSQNELDALLSGSDLAETEPPPDNEVMLLSEDELDEALQEEPPVAAGPIAQDDIDALLAGMGDDDTGTGEPSEDDVEDLLRFSREQGDEKTATSQDMVGENLAAAGTPQDDDDLLLSQDLLDNLVEDARGTVADDLLDRPSAGGGAAPPPEPPEADRAPEPAPRAQLGTVKLVDEARPEAVPKGGRKRRFRKPLIPKVDLNLPRASLPKAAASLAAGLLAATLMFLFLNHNQARRPDLADLRRLDRGDLLVAVRAAQETIRQGNYPEAAALIDKAVEDAPESHPHLPEAWFTRLEARYRMLPFDAPDATVDALQTEIDGAVARFPAYPGIPRALEWKADLFRRNGQYLAALDVYRQILTDHADAPGLDRILLDAARLALDQNYPNDTTEFLRRMMQFFPESPLLAEARLLLGDAYRVQNRAEAARDQYQQVYQAHPDSSLGAQAATRLARLALAQNNPGEAVRLLENRLQSATVASGADEVYLELARAYRAMGRLREAEQELRDLITFFPDSPSAPGAYVELAEVLDSVGQRREAAHLSAQAAGRFPEDPDVMRSHARFQAAAGDTLGAAESLMTASLAADDAPELLLEAARNYLASGMTDQAMDTYARLAMDHPTDPAAMEARIETAKLLFEQGQAREAIRRLRDLATLTQGRTANLAVTVALGEVYTGLGLDELAAQSFQRAATMSTDPELLATTAVALFRSGATEEAASVAARVDLNRISDRTAYAFLNAEADALMQVDPARAVDRMERAHSLYPEFRTADDMRRLLEACLKSGRHARARVVADELESRARTNAADQPVYKKAALLWADDLYGRGDYQAAATAYAAAEAAGSPLDADSQWARFQQANALMRLEQFDRALPLLDEIAASDSAWAESAGLQAAYARLRQEARGASPFNLAAGG